MSGKGGGGVKLGGGSIRDFTVVIQAGSVTANQIKLFRLGHSLTCDGCDRLFIDRHILGGWVIL